MNKAYKFKGITVGTYITKRPKEKTNEDVCAKCINNKNYDKQEQYELCKECNKFYISKTCKAVLTIGKDDNGKTLRKSFVANTEEEALGNALQYKLNLGVNNESKTIASSNKTIVDFIKPFIDEQFKLNLIKESTYKRKLETLRQIESASFSKKMIEKVTRDDVVNYLATLKSYSKTTIKQNYELLSIGFGEAYHKSVIRENFLSGYKKVEKPKSEYNGHHRISLTIEEQKKLIEFLNGVSYSKFKYKYLLLLLLSTGMRIGEALVLNYMEDIDLDKGTITIRRTQTKGTDGKSKIGETTKTFSGKRVLNLNDISKKILVEAVKHIVPNEFNLLFYNPENKQYGLFEEGSINSALKRAGLKLGIGIYEVENSKGERVVRTDIHTHMLRGTYATRCAEAKIDPNVLKEMLGHSDISITMKYYIGIDRDFIKSENKNVVNYLIDKNIFNIILKEDELVV